MTKGESLRAIVDYDLFDVNINGEIGIYLRTNPISNKHLIHFPINGEYAELTDEQIERIDPDCVSPENEEFASRTKTLAESADS